MRARRPYLAFGPHVQCSNGLELGNSRKFFNSSLLGIAAEQNESPPDACTACFTTSLSSLSCGAANLAQASPSLAKRYEPYVPKAPSTFHARGFLSHIYPPFSTTSAPPPPPNRVAVSKTHRSRVTPSDLPRRWMAQPSWPTAASTTPRSPCSLAAKKRWT